MRGPKLDGGIGNEEGMGGGGTTTKEKEKDKGDNADNLFMDEVSPRSSRFVYSAC